MISLVKNDHHFTPYPGGSRIAIRKEADAAFARSPVVLQVSSDSIVIANRHKNKIPLLNQKENAQPQASTALEVRPKRSETNAAMTMRMAERTGNLWHERTYRCLLFGLEPRQSAVEGRQPVESCPSFKRARFPRPSDASAILRGGERHFLRRYTIFLKWRWHPHKKVPRRVLHCRGKIRIPAGSDL